MWNPRTRFGVILKVEHKTWGRSGLPGFFWSPGASRLLSGSVNLPARIHDFQRPYLL